MMNATMYQIFNAFGLIILLIAMEGMNLSMVKEPPQDELNQPSNPKAGV